MSELIHVGIVDDHVAMRESLARLLNDHDDIEVVGEASDGVSALEMLDVRRPRVMVVDISMPRMNGIELTREVQKRWPDVRVLALTMHEDGAALQEMLMAGASGFVSKRMASNELIAAILDVAKGRTVIRADLAGSPLLEPENAAGEVDLTRRETEVLRLVAGGLTSREIGEALGISRPTVDTYRRRIAEKLGVKGRAAMVRYALRHGIVETEG